MAKKPLTDKQISEATVAATMGVPVDPGLGVPQEEVAAIRDDVTEIMERGSTPLIPDSTDNFDMDEFKDE